MNTDVFAAMQRLGAELSPAVIEQTRALFTALAPRLTADICRVERDIAYGPDARHRLDVFQPPAAVATGRSVLVFVHGGGFVAGDKGGADAPFYNNVGVWAVQQGLIGVTLTYRLAPGAQWPAGAEDLASAVAWLGENIGRFGGSPERIFLMGQSAGAAHVASYVAGHHGVLEGASAGPKVAGAIMLSGLYDILTLKHGPYEAAYYGADRSQYAERSSLDGLIHSGLPCLYSVAELDPAVFQQQAGRLVEAYRAANGIWPRMLYLQGHNHLSPVLQIGSSIDTVGADLLHFIRRFSAS